MRERAPAKVNLVLQVGDRRADGLHEICSLFASLELADALEIEAADGPGSGGRDRVVCPGVEGPNLAGVALAAYRAANPGGAPPPLTVHIEKRVPVAAGLGGGSADAAAVLRAAERLADRPLGHGALRTLAAGLGADVPSQLEPRHALVTGAGEHVELVDLPPMTLVLVPQRVGLSTARVYAEADRLVTKRSVLEPERLRKLARAAPLEELAAACENDLEPAALALRPELAGPLEDLREAGAAAALISGSGPTAVGVFADAGAAARAAAGIEGALVTGLRAAPRGDRPRHRRDAPH